MGKRWEVEDHLNLHTQVSTMVSEPRHLIRTVDVFISKEKQDYIDAYENIESSVSSHNIQSQTWVKYYDQNAECHPALFYYYHPNVGIARLLFSDFMISRCLTWRMYSDQNWTKHSPPYGRGYMILSSALYDAGLEYSGSKSEPWRTTEKFSVPAQEIEVKRGKKKINDYALFYPFFDTLAPIKFHFNSEKKTFDFYPANAAVPHPHAMLSGMSHAGFILASEVEQAIETRARKAEEEKEKELRAS